MELMLDSGAYSLFQNFVREGKLNKEKYGESDELWNYVNKYIGFVKKNKKFLSVYVTVDIIRNPELTWKIQKYIESQNLTPLPVFQSVNYNLEFQDKWFKKYLDNYEYFGVGGLGKVGKGMVNKGEVIAMYERVFNTICNGGEPQWKIHGFGITSLNLLHQFPFYSTDSTSWVYFARYGCVLIPRFDPYKKIYIYSSTPHVLGFSTRSPKRLLPSQQHLDTLPVHQRNHIIRYIRTKGYKVGKSEWEEKKGKKKEIVIETGLSNNHNQRDELNLLFYLGVVKRLPDWPWSMLKSKRKNTLFPSSLDLRQKERDWKTERPKYFAAGCFPRMKNPELELDLRRKMVEKTKMPHRRLITFYFPDDAQRMIDLKINIMEEKK